MSKYNLSEEDKEQFLKYVGLVDVGNVERFYKEILELANKSRWTNKDIIIFNILINKELGYFLQSVFRDKFQHPLYRKHFGQKVFTKPTEWSEYWNMLDKYERNEISLEEFQDKCGNTIILREPKMSNYDLSAEEKKELLKFVGCNTITDSEGFYKVILDIANKEEWNDEDLSTLNMLTEDGMGFFLQCIFRDKFQHPLYMKHFNKKVYTSPPMGINGLQAIAEKLKSGEINVEDLSKYGCRIRPLEEVVGRK